MRPTDGGEVLTPTPPKASAHMPITTPHHILDRPCLMTVTLITRDGVETNSGPIPILVSEGVEYVADAPRVGHQAGPQTGDACAPCGNHATQPGGLVCEHGQP